MSNDPLRYFSASRTFATLEAIWRQARWCTSKGVLRAAETMVAELQQSPGALKAKVEKLPADGKTFFGGWVMPKAWDVTRGRLTVAQPAPLPGKKELVLADYHENSFSLFLWSPPTPPEGLTGEVVIVDDPLKSNTPVRNKFVLVKNCDFQTTDKLARAGALCVLSDFIPPIKGIREGKFLDKAALYRNYANAPWDGHERRLPGFSLTPKNGQVLRKLLAKHRAVRLHAQVDSRLYDGATPLVNAVLPGKSKKEIVLTCHMDEPGASDNASGSALALEVLRALAAYTKERGRPLARGVRLLASTELRGVQAYLNTSGYGREVMAGLNVDMIAYEHLAGRCRVNLYCVQPARPSVLEYMFFELVAAEAKRKPLFRYRFRRRPVVNDCQFVGAPFNAPMCYMDQAHDKTYHTSLDVPENLSVAHIKRIGRIIMRVVAFMADAGPAEIEALGARIYRQARQDLCEKDVKLRFILNVGEVEARWAELKKMWPDGSQARKVAFSEKVAAWSKQLKVLADKQPAAPAAAPLPAANPQLVRTAQSLTPLKTFAGYFAFEDLTLKEKETLQKNFGVGGGWGPPSDWQMLLDLSDGRRSLFEIYQRLLKGSVKLSFSLAQLLKIARYLERGGKMKLLKH